MIDLIMKQLFLQTILVTCVKYLGKAIDKNLSWSEYTKQIYN